MTRNLDLAQVEAAITPRTKLLLPVDLAGLPVDRTRLYALAQQHGLRVLEDAAQSMGATWQGQKIGSFGDLVSFSFHANKNMTSGEGGCLVLNNEAEAARKRHNQEARATRPQPEGRAQPRGVEATTLQPDEATQPGRARRAEHNPGTRHGRRTAAQRHNPDASGRRDASHASDAG